jgi:hypothetical protein
VIDARQRGSLAEVRREDADPHPEQLRQLLLIPPHGLRVAEVYDSVVHRRLAVGAQDGVALLDGLFVQLVLRVEIR